jgi:hypothetical protein
MSIRTPEQLSDAVSADLIWRKKELAAVRFFVDSGSLAPDRQKVLMRSSMALLYAHWEGFIKTASRAYVEFVQFQRQRYDELATNFVALGARGILSRASATAKLAVHMELVEFFTNRFTERAQLPYREGISTKWNLSAEVFREINDSLGFDYRKYETKDHLIDVRLLKARNSIAHGEYLLIDVDDYRQVSEQVIEMMNSFRTDIDNAVVLRRYRSAA